MARFTAWTIWVMAVTFSVCGSGAAYSQETDKPFFIKMVGSEVNEYQTLVGGLATSLPSEDQSSVLNLLEKQQGAFAAFQSEYANTPKMSSQQDLSNRLSEFFDFGRQIFSTFDRSKGTTLAGQSDSPHHCSNHCYQSCGYNSVGDLICYNKCVKCCNAGGC